MSKLGAVLVCLVFAACFGGVGAGASWALWRMVYDGHRAQDWVRVRATVDSVGRGTASYRYAWEGREYHGDRLGPDPLGGTDNLDSWHNDMRAKLEAARDGKGAVTVWVNPQEPSESMVDRDVRWKLAVFMLPFALGFGGVGVGALFVLVRTLVKRDAQATAARAVRRTPTAVTGLGARWAFAIMWNVIAFPIALLVLPGAIDRGQWAALLGLVFPIIGVLILWGVIRDTLRAIRAAFVRAPQTGAAEIAPTPAPGAPKHDGFARGMIDDPRASAGPDVIDTADSGLPPLQTKQPQ